MSDAFYFGCWLSLGHYAFAPGMRSAPWQEWSACPFRHRDSGGLGCDAVLAPGFNEGRHPRGVHFNVEGAALLHHADGWTAVSFWDRSVDARGAANSTFILRGTLSFDEAMLRARALFPELFERFTFEIRLMTP